ncbi:hypothetical protein PITC_085740 [Penicillium italicum]|uniref:Uncharacterized protein n=1 Tax=Penicillium italicum TaxID=40296 RepID=A0A0A2L2N4_PENIT|nr:hypothetical protein PITC_085740 [Penicillium italicum]
MRSRLPLSLSVSTRLDRPWIYIPLSDSGSNLGVAAQIEQLAREKDAKLPGLKILEGVYPHIPNGFTVKQWQGENDKEPWALTDLKST